MTTFMNTPDVWLNRSPPSVVGEGCTGWMDEWLCGHTSTALWKWERNCPCQGMLHLIYFRHPPVKEMNHTLEVPAHLLLLGRDSRLTVSQPGIPIGKVYIQTGFFPHLAFHLLQIYGTTQFICCISVKTRDSLFMHTDLLTCTSKAGK